MYDRNQVLRFENKYKASNLGGLGIELIQRKGTGNYDKNRTIFNYSYVPLSKTTLQEQVYSKLKGNKIYYNDGNNTNLLNGAIITSGKDFFQSLGMKFKEKMFNFCDKIWRALGHKIGIHISKKSEINYNDMEYYAKNINRKYEKSEKDKSDDFEIGM